MASRRRLSVASMNMDALLLLNINSIGRTFTVIKNEHIETRVVYSSWETWSRDF